MDTDKLLTGLLRGPLTGALGTGLLAGLASRGLRRRGMRLGGLALLGGLAWMAYRRFADDGAGPVGAPPTPASTSTTVVRGTPDQPSLSSESVDESFLPAGEAAREELGVLLVRAMIAAAKADGELDFAESTHIFGRISDLELDDEERAFLERELAAPLDVQAIAAGARTPEQRTEVYAASLVVAADRNDAERAYLRELAERLGLDERLVRELEAEVASRRD